MGCGQSINQSVSHVGAAGRWAPSRSCSCCCCRCCCRLLADHVKADVGGGISGWGNQRTNVVPGSIARYVGTVQGLALFYSRLGYIAGSRHAVHRQLVKVCLSRSGARMGWTDPVTSAGPEATRAAAGRTIRFSGHDLAKCMHDHEAGDDDPGQQSPFSRLAPLAPLALSPYSPSPFSLLPFPLSPCSPCPPSPVAARLPTAAAPATKPESRANVELPSRRRRLSCRPWTTDAPGRP